MLLMRVLALLLMLGGCTVSKLDAERAFSLHGQAETLYQQGDYTLALPLFQQLARQFPREAEFQLRIGNCYAFESKYEQAVEAFELAVAIDPQLSRAWYNLSYVRAQMLAATVTRMYENLDPSDPDAQRMRKLVIAVLAPFGEAMIPPLSPAAKETSVDELNPAPDKGFGQELDSGAEEASP